jgi:hypothetical protein
MGISMKKMKKEKLLFLILWSIQSTKVNMDVGVT